ncbi:MAG: glycosyl transferase group 1 [Solirubrobacterales bacterium]|nr:glycosyl transferase group 1 [Solirubrobacterales bacterium]
MRVVSGTLFYPRGGSAYVARALANGLADRASVDLTLVAGSRHDRGDLSDARVFYGGLDLHEVDFTAALATADPVALPAPEPGTAPLQPSYEDRADVPDRYFASLDGAAYEEQVLAWSRELHAAGAADADVLHLHHLTPLHEAAARVAPDVPIVTHLHGTELLMLEAIAAGEMDWPYAEAWRERLCRWASASRRLIVAPGNRRRAMRLLDLERSRFADLPNGFDPVAFRPLEVDRGAVWRRVLVEDPRGWLPGQEPGSIAYDERVLDGIGRGPVILFVGRFTSVKRLPLLLEAFAAARARMAGHATLVLVGGHPGEWEGEHPAQTIARLGLDDVLLAGWHDQSELPELLGAADLLVLPSVRESFGQVIVEAMACGVAPVAAASLGPAHIIDDGRTGWLFDVDDAGALTDALVHAVDDRVERERRARAAEQAALERFTWPAVAGRLERILRSATTATRDRADVPDSV